MPFFIASKMKGYILTGVTENSTKKYRLYKACKYFSYCGTVKDPDTSNIFIYNIQKMLKYQ